MLTATSAVVAAPLAAPALAQAGPALTLTATPDPATAGATITLTATSSGVSPLSGHTVHFGDEARPGCICGADLGEAVTDASGVASITVPATSPPLLPPALRTHNLHAFALVDVLLDARTTGAVVCPPGQSPDATGNACGIAPGAIGTTLTVDPPVAGLFTLRARLTRTDTGAPITGKTVVMSTSASALCDAVTDADGVAQCGGLQSAIPVLLDNGYTAAFAGDSEFLASSARATVMTGGRASSAAPRPATPTNPRPTAGAPGVTAAPSGSEQQLPATGGVPGLREAGLLLLVLGVGAALGRRALPSSPPH